MQGNSKYLRWSPLYTCCCIFVILSSTVIAVPVRPRRMIRETFTPFEATNSNSISNVTCLRDGIEVQKSTVKCEVKSGCRLIQKTGECCPEYQCDCYHEDKTYENGAETKSPDPCKRCFCKGGEVKCNEISCYIRKDCEPKYIKDVCCPLYDNCPPLDDAKFTAKESDANKSTSRNDVIISLSTTTISSDLSKDDKNLQLANENPLGIKIKEITKPEEIRITDDKPKAFKPTKSTTTTTTTTTEASTTTLATTEASIDSTSTQAEQTSSKRSLTIIEDTNPPAADSKDYMDDGATAIEIEPEFASPSNDTFDVVEPELLLVNADANTIGDETSSKNVRQTIESSTIHDIEPPSENVSELYSSTTDGGIEITNGDVSTSNGYYGEVVSSTPSIVVVVKQGGKTESYLVDGIEGLVRGDVTENSQSDSNESGGHNDGTERSPSTTEENVSESSSTTTTIVSLEKFDDDEINATVKELNDSMNDGTVDSSTASNNDASTASSEQSSESASDISSTSTTEESSTVALASEKSLDGENASSTVDTIDLSSTTLAPVSSNNPNDEDILSSTDRPSSTTPSTQESTPHTRSEPCAETSSRSTFEDDETTNAENPEYPYIPDDLTNHCKQIEEEEEEAKRRHSHSNEMSSSTTDSMERSSTSEATVNKQSTTQGPLDDGIKQSHEMDQIEARAPGEPHLIPEWERTTTAKPLPEDSTAIELSTTNGPVERIELTNALKANNESDTKQKDKPSEVSSDESLGTKEPTTERPTTRGYTDSIEIDDASKSSTEVDVDSSTLDNVSPKDDAESVKLSSSSSDDDSFKSAFRFLPDAFGEYIRVVYEMNKKEMS